MKSRRYFHSIFNITFRQERRLLNPLKYKQTLTLTLGLTGVGGIDGALPLAFRFAN